MEHLDEGIRYGARVDFKNEEITFTRGGNDIGCWTFLEFFQGKKGDKWLFQQKYKDIEWQVHEKLRKKGIDKTEYLDKKEKEKEEKTTKKLGKFKDFLDI